MTTYDDRVLDLVPVPMDEAGVLAVLGRIASALSGGAPFVPYAAGSPPPELPVVATGALPDGLAMCVGTSGSTGPAKLAMLSADSLAASASGTHAALGGPGRWLLAMPGHHVAGTQVLVRSVLADQPPAVLDLSRGFTVDGFVDATAGLGSGRRYTALVPTQVRRLLAEDEGREALAAYDAVLVGGARTPPDLVASARAADVALVTTYGMSETAGGCVYDGRPLPGTRVRSVDGRLELGGATLAAGYLGRPDLTAAAFVVDPDGSHWFRTDDVGHRDPDGRWHVEGRIDELINSGGLKISPRTVEDALTAPGLGVSEAVVVGVPDRQWGETVAAAVVPAEPSRPPTIEELRSGLRAALPRHALPRRLLVLEQMPLRGPGKPDRQALRRLLERTSDAATPSTPCED